MRQTRVSIGVAAALGLVSAATAQPGDLANMQDVVTSGLSAPLYVVSPPGDDTRLFIVQQGGQIRLTTRADRDSNWNPTTTLFLDVGSLLTPNSGTVSLTTCVDHDCNSGTGCIANTTQNYARVRGNEQGLLGLAFAPDYETSGVFYINYVGPRNAFAVISTCPTQAAATDVGQTIIARYRRSAGNPNVADAASAQVVLTQTQPFTNHNGGNMNFGPDGFLYIGTGDGGSGNDPNNDALDPNELLGKLLRIDVDGADNVSGTADDDGFPADPNRLYTIPADNPFAGGGGRGEIWARGLRNPWRWSFDRVTGDLYIADVGQNVIEEVNFVPGNGGPGRNYGWRVREGNNNTGLSSGGFDISNLTGPLYTYSHGSGALQGFSITGGYVYRGTAIRAWRGRYFFADYVNRRLFSARVVNGVWTDFQDIYNNLNPSTNTALRIQTIGSFGQDNAGELYIVELGPGRVRKMVPQDPQPNPVDFNFDGNIDPDDLGDYINAYFTFDLRADFNLDDNLDPDDLGDYINAYFGP
ncbi:MAG: sorbosone dehydrogenase family protein [Phycisphaerales bacterium]